MKIAKMFLLLLPVLGGCGHELTAGGYGSVETAVVDEPPSGSGPNASHAAGARRFSITPQSLTAARGQVEVEASAVLVSSDGVTVAITAQNRMAGLELAAGDTARLDTREVPAGRYTAARVTFRQVAADVSSGLLVGPLSVAGRIRVVLPEAVTVEKAIQLEVLSDGEHSLLIDVNSAVWLATADPVLKTVSAASFVNAVEVRVK